MEKEKHKQAIYELTQNTLAVYGNTYLAVRNYCKEHNLSIVDTTWEGVRFTAVQDFLVSHK